MDSPGDEHLVFTQWAASNGVQINGIAPARFPGRRLGMVATRTLQEDEVILSVPLALMVTIDSIPSWFVDRFPENASIQAIMSAYLTHGDAELLKPLDAWRRTWPSLQEFEDTMPVLWPEHLRRLNSSGSGTASSSSSEPSILPPSISGSWNSFSKTPVNVDYETRYQQLLAQQEKRLKDSWEHVTAVFPDTKWESFAWNWFIINSRSFYYTSPGKGEPEDWNDAIALVPFADYFNHEDDAACGVNFDGSRYTFTATKKYKKGEEIFMSYGAHSNDFLLVEYGFYLDRNESDSIYLDDIIFPELSLPQKKELALREYFGNYEVLEEGPSTSTQLAACLKYMSLRDWRKYVLGQSDRSVNRQTTAAVIREWVDTYRKESIATIEIIENMKRKAVAADSKAAESKKETERLDMILGRWRQIQRLCEKVIERLR
ncbi:SET domain-containing protein [Aspergillus melleus]|uniref:SET domain-containing protein n=1 Tax=Aspergillus melleus TaxID=138277 RepID=UPI001E8E7B07|nr:uncharacterized protein LDX57_007190 [Aspergillus melleus]KAH8429528.1 hypothetical protein LDX57_007190 [Aspergillus melleus]